MNVKGFEITVKGNKVVAEDAFEKVTMIVEDGTVTIEAMLDKTNGRTYRAERYTKKHQAKFQAIVDEALAPEVEEVTEQEENFKACLEEAEELYKGQFIPELDNLQNDTVADVLFKVLHEWDLATEGETKVPRSHLKKAESFMAKWAEFIEPEQADEKDMYKQFRPLLTKEEIREIKEGNGEIDDHELEALAADLAMEYWGKDLKNLKVRFRPLNNSYGQYRYNRKTHKGKSKYTPLEILISSRHGLEKPEHRQQLLSVLKHELCHWACQQAGKPFSDGSKFFESELYRVGAGSTGRDLFNYDEEVTASKAHQQEIMEGKKSLLGRTAFSYKEVAAGKKYKKRYEVYYNGEHIGDVGDWGYGKYRWNPISKHHDYGRLSWTARKHAVEDLLEKYKERDPE